MENTYDDPRVSDKRPNMWKDALESTRNLLGEDDFEYVAQFDSAEQMLQEIQRLQHDHEREKPAAARLLGRLHGSLVHLKTWATFLVVQGDASLAYVWGVVYLLVELSSRCADDEAFREVSQYLDDLSQKIELFDVYRKSKSIYLDSALLNGFFELLVDLVVACAHAIKFFRRNSNGSRGRSSFRVVDTGTWSSSVQSQFADLLKNFTARVEILREKMETHQLSAMRLKQDQAVNMLSEMQKKAGEDKTAAQRDAARLPYYQLPFGRNPTFCGRDDVLSRIQAVLRPEPTVHTENADLYNPSFSHPSRQPMSSVAIWGIGGIGKSQIALQYANLQAQDKCQFVLWIPAQTEIDISRALVRAAGQVHPPGYEEGMTAEQMRLIMWNWLQTTDATWLLIFDNVDDNVLLASNWPVAGPNGQILVTCRSELVATSPAAAAIEIPCFTPQQGGQLLLCQARKTNVSQDEIAHAEKLSDMLGGLALALDIMARQIFVKKKTMAEFLPYFIKNKKNLRKPPRHAPNNPYYNETLDTVWQTAFDSLDNTSAQLLHLFCFCAPDDIPRAIIHTPDCPVPEVWAFLSDMQEYEDAEAQLLNLSLIKITETGMISLHRLVQDAYYDHVTDAQHHEAFGVMYRLLCAAFPKRTLRRQMYEVWGQCEMLVHHIEALQSRYDELRGTGLDVQDLALHTMLADATWFCGETCALQLGETLGKRAAGHCADKDSLIYAYLCESVATIDHRRGRYQDAHTFFARSLAIREKDPTTTAPELADAYSAIGLALFGLFASEEAIVWVDKALAVAYAAPKAEQRTFNIDRYLRNRSRPRAALRNFSGAKKDVADAEAFQTMIYGADGHFHGETAYILGKIAIVEGDLDEAARQLQRAYDLQYPGKPMHQSVASALYHQARVCTLRVTSGSGDEEARKENDNQALVYLQQALAITQFNEARRGDQGESARVKWKIADIWERQGRAQDAATYRAAALREKSELERTGLYPKAPDEEQAWDCFSDLVDR